MEKFSTIKEPKEGSINKEKKGEDLPENFRELKEVTEEFIRSEKGLAPELFEGEISKEEGIEEEDIDASLADLERRASKGERGLIKATRLRGFLLTSVAALGLSLGMPQKADAANWYSVVRRGSQVIQSVEYAQYKKIRLEYNRAISDLMVAQKRLSTERNRIIQDYQRDKQDIIRKHNDDKDKREEELKKLEDKERKDLRKIGDAKTKIENAMREVAAKRDLKESKLEQRRAVRQMVEDVIGAVGSVIH